MPDFSNILTKAVDDFKPPVALPPGSYSCIIKSHKLEEIGKNKTPGVIVILGIMAPMADVDQAELEKIEEWQKRELRATFWLTEDSVYRLGEFLKNDLQMNTEGRSLDEVLSEIDGKTVTVFTQHRMTTEGNKQRVYSDISGFAPAE